MFPMQTNNTDIIAYIPIGVAVGGVLPVAVGVSVALAGTAVVAVGGTMVDVADGGTGDAGPADG